MSDQITEKTTVNLPISSWWQFLMIVLVIVSCYFGLKGDTDKAVSMSNATAQQQRTTDQKVNAMEEKVTAMQMDIRSVADDVKWFRQTYEKDMNHYIRDTKTR